MISIDQIIKERKTMKKHLITILVSIASICFVATTSFAAEMRMGVSGSLVKVEAQGTSTTNAGDTSNQAASADNIAGAAMVYLDYVLDNGIVFGLELLPYGVDVSSKAKSRADVTTDANETNQDDGTRTAQAEVELLRTLYVEYPMGNTFVKLGYSQVDVNTQETSTTNPVGGSYGDETLNGYTVGLGFTAMAGDWNTKYLVEYTDFEDLDLNNGTGSTINADLDITALKFAIGKAF